MASEQSLTPSLASGTILGLDVDDMVPGSLLGPPAPAWQALSAAEPEGESVRLTPP